jgi:uncharacterized protein (TIGR03083 family)
MPAQQSIGLAGTDPSLLGQRVLAAWDAFLDCAAAADLSRPSRLPGWTGRDVCVHLGSWDDEDPVADLLAAARSGVTQDHPPSPDDLNARKLARHANVSVEEAMEAVRHARESVARAFQLPELAELGVRPTMSTVGPLPLLTHLHAGAYELAVHALDLMPCGAPRPTHELLHAGIAALADVTGGLAARHNVRARVTSMTPQGGWMFEAADGGWETFEVGPDAPLSGAVIRADEAVLLDASAGRVSVPPLLLDGRLKVHDMAMMLRLAPLLDEVPGLPGGGPLKVAVKVIGGVRGGASALLDRLRHHHGPA